MNTFATYYWLTKPGIIYGNAITAGAGFFVASKGHVSLSLLLAMLIGLSLVIASACVFNNYIDRDIDAVMARTRKRALVKGLVSLRHALAYATILGLAGAMLLAAGTNLLTLALALAGWFFYVVVYGIAKRRTVHGTVIGSISGAVPPVVGYAAVTGHLDLGALLLFVILVLWQMPHFYAIAIYRREDYAAAHIPILPIVSGPRAAKIQILLYIAAFMIASLALTAFGYAGYAYLAVAAVLGLTWLGLGLRGFAAANDQHWARKMFRFSLIVITLLCIVMSLNIA
jgi:protoheme IX farnesyltransferase